MTVAQTVEDPPESIRLEVDPGVGSTVRRVLGSEGLLLPLPGHGRTAQRWSTLRMWGAGDLSAAKTLESHADAVAILAEAGRGAEPGALYAVWASGLGGGLRFERDGDRQVVAGTLQFASGARFVDRALVVARDDDGRAVLCELVLADIAARPVAAAWRAVGMEATDSVDLDFERVAPAPGSIVGAPDWYLDRPGFWIGAIGVAAVWAGALDALVATVVDALRRQAVATPHQVAHLGACVVHQHTVSRVLDDAARIVDASPGSDHRHLANVVRTAVESAAQDVLVRTNRALGAGPLARDAVHARRMADLPVYLRQHHAERDLERLGLDAIELDGWRL